MSQPSTSKPPMFAAPPRSALFSKLESFLPVLATENKKLEEAIAAGEGGRHNIEIPEPDAASDDGASENSDDDVDMEAAGKKPRQDGATDRAPVIEMNFALGMMEENASDSDSSSDSEDENDDDIDLAASIAGIKRGDHSAAPADSALRLPSQQPTKKPMIVELD
ncbi:hypothetical protein P43SY_007211 [Pythium insidiosum]|uniref:Uncharacterized protein n=1 Tax=Pythium insidiosum TaxID=114742 RepID=A0AAD5QAM5_PYTIN|nr:hypothetical protein P43SY_007211 [Pythium insidiosum]KAJ0407282.1 hypothetical protein ATCC90586_003140 [Pythium insidiosum]